MYIGAFIEMFAEQLGVTLILFLLVWSIVGRYQGAALKVKKRKLFLAFLAVNFITICIRLFFVISTNANFGIYRTEEKAYIYLYLIPLIISIITCLIIKIKESKSLKLITDENQSI